MIQNVSQLLRIVDEPNLDLQDVQLAVDEYLQQHRDKEVVHQLVQLYLQSKSSRVLTLLSGLRDPYNKWLLERCSENIKQNEGALRIASLKLLLCIVQKDPPWLHDNHPKILKDSLNILREGSDVSACFISIVIMASILPLIPGAFDKRGLEMFMFKAFSAAAELCVKRKDDFAEINRQHLCSGLYTLYKVLYAMFPCNFLAFLRTTYGSSDRPEHRAAWSQIIWPMMKRTYFHPFLVQYNCDSETHKDRWKGQQKHDIIADCQIYFSDQRPDRPVEPVRAKMTASKPYSIPKKKSCLRDMPSSDSILGKTPNLLDVLSTQPPSDVSSSLGSVDIAEEANPEPSSRTDDSGVHKHRSTRRASANVATLPTEFRHEDDDSQEANDRNKGFCSTTQRLTQEPTNSISEHAETQADPPPHSEMECLLASSSVRHRYVSQCQPSPPHGSPQFLSKLTRSMSCPSSQLQTQQEDSTSLSETTSSSNEDLSSKCLSLSLWPNSPEPRKPDDSDNVDEKSPAEILEDHMKVCAIAVLKENDLQAINHSGKELPVAIDDLQKELMYTKAYATMLYVELLYDRHRKDIHIERNRRLLEKAKRIIQLEEKNAAMSGEVREVREELIAKTKKIAELQKMLDKTKNEMQSELKTILERDVKLAEDNNKNLYGKEQVMLINEEQKSKLEETRTQSNSLNSELHEAKLQLENISLKAEDLAAYKEKCIRLEQELITLQEMYQRQEEISKSNVHDVGQLFTADDLTKELKQCKARLEHRKQESEAASDRFRIQQGRAEEAEKVLREVRKHLMQVEGNSTEQLRAKDDHINALRRSHERLQLCVLQLHGKVDEASAPQPNIPDLENGEEQQSEEME